MTQPQVSGVPIRKQVGARIVSPQKRTRSRFITRILKQRSLMFWTAVVGLIVLASVLAPFITPHYPNVGVMSDTMAPPGGDYPLGADRYGRDVLTRLLFGGQIALMAAVEAVGIAIILGIPLGLIVGYVGGWTDRIVMRVVDGIMSVPFLILAIAVIAAIGPGLFKSMAVVGLVYAMIMLRLTRGEVLSAREELYVEGLQVSGAGSFRLLFRHILPNIAPPLIVQSTLMFATAIIAEATLSYLGLGVAPPTASWGSMLAEAQTTINQNFFLAIPPGLAIFITVLAINQVGDGLRDIFSREITPGKLGLNVVNKATEPAEVTGTPDVAAPETDVSPVLRVRGLTVSFPQHGSGRVNVVQDVNLDIHRGELVGLVGESGSGKSVTAMSMLGLVAHPGTVTAESVELTGEEITGMGFDELRKIRGRRIGVVFQDALGSLNPAYTVGNQVSEAIREHFDVTAAEARRRGIELFDQVGIPNAADRYDNYPHQFSGGMAQRVMIAMALSCDPDVLVADEPTTALDVTVQKQILDLLTALIKDRGLAVLLITHDLGVVAEVADRVAVMYAGQIVESGPVDEVFTAPQHPYTQGLLDSIPRNTKATGRLASIPGVVPQPAEWPISCHFASRCAFATEQCTAGFIPLENLGHGRHARCVRVEELNLKGIKPLDVVASEDMTQDLPDDASREDPVLAPARSPRYLETQ